MTGKIVVAGALGLVGRGVLEHFETERDWDIVALSRRTPDFQTRAQSIPVDLTDRADCEARLGRINDATHLVFAAFQGDEVASNLAMLANLMAVIEPNNRKLRHVTLLQGGKAYGAHLGQMKVPGREDQPRHAGPNFYYAQEDHLRALQQGKRWHWTVLRPMSVLGDAVASPMNILAALAAYGAIARELGQSFAFPGATRLQLGEFTDNRLLARAIQWAGQAATARNEVFNITNGDVIVWQHLWPALAQQLRLESGEARPAFLAQAMADKAPVWDRIVAKHGLQPRRFEQMVGASWQFADALLGAGDRGTVALLSTVKIRQAGFQDCLDSEQALRWWFVELRRRRVMP